MHRTKPQADRCNARQRAADHRQKTQKQRRYGAVNQQQQRGNERNTDQRQPVDLVFDSVA